MRNASPRKSPLVVLWAALGATALAASGLIVGAAAPDAVVKPTEWKHWGGDPGVSRFSPIDQITAANVARLQPAWVYDTATFGRSWEVTPLLVDGLLYIADPRTTDVVALEPETGKELWRHKPPSGLTGGDIRGLSYWEGDGSMKPRIIMIWGHNMFGLDPKSGQLSGDWPATGHNIMLPPVGMSCETESACGGVPQKSPPVIYKNLIILADASGFLPYPVRPADPRAYDLRTGKLTWISRLVPNPGEEGGDSWGPDPRSVAGNGSWGILSLDEKTGTVYVPTDSGSPDLVGIWRPGDNKWANSTVALDAATGKMKWAFQNHRHDIYDYDTMAAPVPVDITRNGQKVPVIVQTTKQGMMWIVDALTGKPIHPFEERPIAQSKIPGEKTAATQLFTLAPPPLGQMSIDREHLSQLSAKSNAECKAVWDEKKLQNSGPYTPPAADGAWTVMQPGAIGGIDWGGASIDPALGYAITNVVNMPTMIQVTKGDGKGGVRGNDGYTFSSGYVRFSDSNGRPCSGGRMGELVAVNIATGAVVWTVPLGTLEDEYGENGKQSGATNIGPSLVTQGGVVFIGAATDERFHAYDTRTGKLLWQTKMSTSSNAGPMTYIGKDGRQYVVIAAGGPGNARRRSTNENFAFHQTLVAFALPRAGDRPVDIVTAYPKRPALPGENLGPVQ
jgi:quinoprotein glucose dehydrogenase